MNPPLSFAQRQRRVWRLALPIILSGLTVPLIGAVDTAVVGRLPNPAYIGGVALGAIIFDFVYWGFGFLKMSTTGFAAQAEGAGDRRESDAALTRALLMALGFGGAILLAQIPIGWLAFSLLQGSAEVEAQARIYFSARIWSAPVTLAIYGLLGWLLGRQRTDLVLILELSINLLNVGLSILLGLTLGYGVAGVAWASVAAETAGLALGLYLCRRLGHRIAWGERWRQILDRARLLAMAKINGDILIRTLCLLAAFTVFASAGAALGDLTLAANAILMNIFLLIGYGMDGFANTAQSLVGHAVGAGDRRAYRQAVIDTSLWALALALLAGLALTVFGEAAIALYSVNEAVRAEARAYLPWAIVMPAIAIWCFQLDGIYLGAMRSADMRNGMVISLVVFLLCLWLARDLWGNHGLWFSMAVFFLARTATLGAWAPRIGRNFPPPAPI